MPHYSLFPVANLTIGNFIEVIFIRTNLFSLTFNFSLQIYTLQINAIFSLHYFQSAHVCYAYNPCTYIVVIFILGLHFQSSSSTKHFLQPVCVAKCLSLARYFNNRKTHNKSTQALESNENEHCPQVLQYALSLKHMETYNCACFYLILNTTFIRLTQNQFYSATIGRGGKKLITEAM